MIDNLHEYNFGTHGHYQEGIVYLDHKKFDHPRLKGVQRKGMVFFKDEKGRPYKRFFKLDELNRLQQAHFEKSDDYYYSSVTEAIVSCLIKGMKEMPDFPCVVYEFEVVSEGGKKITGTSSENYISPGYLEFILSEKDDVQESEQGLYNQHFVSYKEYISGIKAAFDNENILNKLIVFFKRYGVKEELARKFILKQGAFDLITGNMDRKRNATNFVFIAKNSENVIPINMDYGRCLQMASGLDTKEIEPESRASIFNNEETFEENVDFLLSEGLEKLPVNLDKVKEELGKVYEKIHRLAPDLEELARRKGETLLKIMANEKVKPLWEESK